MVVDSVWEIFIGGGGPRRLDHDSAMTGSPARSDEVTQPQAKSGRDPEGSHRRICFHLMDDIGVSERVGAARDGPGLATEDGESSEIA